MNDDERLVLVDSHDREIGHLAKADAHMGSGVLHRAFSLFVFNPDGELLVQQRAPGKRLWPGYWSNTCCSHPRPGERMDSAIARRLREELGMTAELGFLFKFEYQTQYDALGGEHELCWVYGGWSADRPRANADEIMAWRYVAPQELQTEMICAPETFTPWFKLEWDRVLRAHSWVLSANLLRALPDNSCHVDAFDQSGRR
ncbi:isopentenyl-diphosphate Delta-isomerase [Mycobacterium sp. 1081908.1]|uniref:isopentenyl-diphosphate Delta-isomerase n=1 Tax=Mycobacterium sp. 1081908.1 TaxID=1834066 RepID=UPI0009EEB57B|nr:isopentenyl-diphosphate Delta-isomerase [Mycobacterium sp. 1081908.1]